MFSYRKMPAYRRYRRRQITGHVLDVLNGIGLSLLGLAIIAFPFIYYGWQ